MAMSNGKGFSVANALQTIQPFTRRAFTSPRLFQLRARQCQPKLALSSVTKPLAPYVDSGSRGVAHIAKVGADLSKEDSGSANTSDNAMNELLEASFIAQMREKKDTLPLQNLNKIAIPSNAPQNRAEIGEQVRQAMRAVPNSVVIITSTDVRGREGKYRGATVSSFNTVTIEPTTIVSVNIKRPSATWDAILSSGYFLVHLLNATESAGTIASAFSKGVTSTPFLDLHQLGLQASLTYLPMEDSYPLRARPPLLKANNDLGRPFAERLLCRGLMDKTVEVDDHVVVFAIVEHVFRVSSIAKQTNRNGLAYANGQYGRIKALTDAHAQNSNNPVLQTDTPVIARTKQRAKTDDDSQPQEVATDVPSATFSRFLWKIQTMDHSVLFNVETMIRFAEKLDPVVYQSWSDLVAAASKTYKTVVIQWGSWWRMSQQTGQSHRQPSATASLIRQASTYWTIFLYTRDLRHKSIQGLREETSELFEKYRKHLLDTHHQVASSERVLQALYDSTALEQPPVHPFYNIRKVASRRLAGFYPYLRSYLLHCLVKPMTLHRNDHDVISSLHPRIAATLVAYLESVEHTGRWLLEEATVLSLTSKEMREGAIKGLQRVADGDIMLVPRSLVPIYKYRYVALIRAYFPALRRTTQNSAAEYGLTCEETFAALMDYRDLVSDPYWKLGLEADPETSRASVHSLAVPQLREKEKDERSAVDVVDTGDGLPAEHIRKVHRGLIRYTPGYDDPKYPNPEELELLEKIKYMDPFMTEERIADENERSIEGELENIRNVMQQEKTEIKGPSAKRMNVGKDAEYSIQRALEDVRKVMQQGKARP